MKVLLTGAFGNIGSHTVQELLRQGQEVRCFDLPTPANQKKARSIAGRAEIVWGDLRNAQEVARAVEGQEVVIHLGYILPPAAYKDPELARAVNMDGTRNVLEAAKSQAQPPKLLFASTFDVYGPTQDQPPPRKVDDPLQVTDEYSEQKILCEKMVRESGLTWAIYRFSDVPPLKPHPPQPIMFAIPLDQRLEMLHPADAALAIANGIRSDIWDKIWLIGGGERCQIRYRDYVQGMMQHMGLGTLPEEAFAPPTQPYCTDWLDTSASQALLHYQRHSFEEILNELARAASPGPLARLAMPLIRGPVRRSILKMSPHLKV